MRTWAAPSFRRAPACTSGSRAGWRPGTRRLGAAGETYWERKRARRALRRPRRSRALPQLAEVRFVGDLRAGDPADLYAVYRLDGHLNVVTAARLDTLLRALPETP